MKVSVAIPIYNAARHLNVTLDSLQKQTMDASEFEVICVNDCSTDNSIEVIEKYQKNMDNLILINRTENSGGPMIPRNNAIQAARGEYIMFLDNDDFLGEEALERLYDAARENRSDVIFGKYVGVNGRHVPESMFKKGNRLNSDILEDNLV
ncbi:glycosyltransferase family 2 protein, partial [Cytobacillus firmus]